MPEESSSPENCKNNNDDDNNDTIAKNAKSNDYLNEHMFIAHVHELYKQNRLKQIIKMY